MRTTGTVTYFNDRSGYGFIAPDDGGADIFAHASAIRGTGRRTLAIRARVEFEIVQGLKGPQAANVALVGEA